MNIQQKVSQLAMKKKQQDTHADAKSHTYDEIQNALSEDQKRLISKYYQQLTSLGFKKEEDVYLLCKKLEFNEKILDDHVKVLITKAREAAEDDAGWVTVAANTKQISAVHPEKSEYSKRENKPYKNRNEGQRGNYPKKQTEDEHYEQKYPKKRDENDQETGGYKKRERYQYKSYKNDEAQDNETDQRREGGYQRGGYKQRERNYNKGYESRKGGDVVYYAKKDDTTGEETKPEQENKPEEKPEQSKTQKPETHETPQTEKPKQEAQESRFEKQTQQTAAEDSDERVHKKSRSPKKGKNEVIVYAVKKDTTEEPASQPASKPETRETARTQVDTHADTRKPQEQRASPTKVEYVQKEQKATTKQQESPHQPQGTNLEKERTQEKPVETQNKEYIGQNLQKQQQQSGKNIGVQHASQTSYTPTTTTTTQGQNFEEIPKNIKNLGQPQQSNVYGGQNFGQLNSYPPGNLQGPSTTQGSTSGQLPGYFTAPQQQQIPQTFIPNFGTFPIVGNQTQGEQKEIPSIFQMPYIVFPQSNGTAIIQPLFFGSGIPQMMPNQGMMPTVIPNPLPQGQFTNKSNTPNFDVSSYFRSQPTDDNISKSKSAPQNASDKSVENQKNTQSNLQESGLYYPFYMPQNPMMGQFKQNPTNV